METMDELEEKARALQDSIRPGIEDARRRLENLNERTIAFIKARPGACLLGALAVGYVIGKIARR